MANAVHQRDRTSGAKWVVEVGRGILIAAFGAAGSFNIALAIRFLPLLAGPGDAGMLGILGVGLLAVGALLAVMTGIAASAVVPRPKQLRATILITATICVIGAISSLLLDPQTV